MKLVNFWFCYQLWQIESNGIIIAFLGSFNIQSMWDLFSSTTRSPLFFKNKKTKRIYLYEQYTTNDCNIFQTTNYISQVIITTDDYKDIYIWKLEVKNCFNFKSRWSRIIIIVVSYHQTSNKNIPHTSQKYDPDPEWRRFELSRNLPSITDRT